LSALATGRNVVRVFGDARRAVIVGGVVVFGLGALVGFLVGRSGRDEDRAAGPNGATGEAAATASASPTPTAAGSPVVVTPAPGQEPAITTTGQVLAEGARPVVGAAPAAPCQSLVSPGSLGDCGEVVVGGGRVVWVVERAATTTGATSVTVRVFTFVADAGGWVEWLQAADPAGERWTDVGVLPADLTGDGVAELVVGYRSTDERETLEYDIVGYQEAGLPVVLAHPDPIALGAAIVSGGQLQDFGAQYPNDEPACCPPSYVRRTIAFDGGFFRVIVSETVPPSAVPPSQL
jgi:hypothetical protein